jgi:hypothetical protein
LFITGRQLFYYGRNTNTSELQARAQYFFSLKEIESATKHFDPESKIGEGGFGPVYKVNTIKLVECPCVATVQQIYASYIDQIICN